MNTVDGALLILLFLAAVRGWLRGAIGQVFGLGGGFLGLLAGIALSPRLAPHLVSGGGIKVAVVSLVLVVVFAIAGQLAGFVVGHRFGRMAHSGGFGALDSALGAGVGILLTLLAVWVVATLLVQGPSVRLAREMRQSHILRVVGRVLPAPPDVLAYLREYLNTSGFPQVFVGFPRPAGPPAKLPKGKEAAAAVASARSSTYRIVAPACGGAQLGSGWLASPRHVVTNAHVVAGAAGVRVETGDAIVSGRVVLFDPDTDIAVILLDGSLSDPVLQLARRPLARGAPGATLGYPGGVRLDAERAAVQDRFQAVGRDIYGEGTVSREVYELHAFVRQGDSGGPFVLPSGRVAGVVFAASTTDPETGYALTAQEVQDEIQNGVGSQRPVPTGHCAGR